MRISIYATLGLAVLLSTVAAQADSANYEYLNKKLRAKELSPADVVKARIIPKKNRNSALFFQKAAANYQESRYGDFLASWHVQEQTGRRDSKFVRELMSRHLSRNNEVLQKLDQAAQLAGGAYPVDSGDVGMVLRMDFVEVSQLLKALNETLEFRSALICSKRAYGRKAELFDPTKPPTIEPPEWEKRVISSLIAQRRLASSFGDPVIVLHHSCRVAFARSFGESIERTLGLVELRRSSIRKLLEELAEERKELNGKLVLYGKAARLCAARRGGPKKWHDARGASFELLLKMIAEAIEVRNTKLPEQIEELDKFRKRFLTEESRSDFENGIIKGVKLLLESDIGEQTHLWQCELALRCELYRLTHDRWPGNFASVVPKDMEKSKREQFLSVAGGYCLKSLEGAVSGRVVENRLALSRQPDKTFALIAPSMRGEQEVSADDFLLQTVISPFRIERLQLTEEELNDLGVSDETLESIRHKDRRWGPSRHGKGDVPSQK